MKRRINIVLMVVCVLLFSGCAGKKPADQKTVSGEMPALYNQEAVEIKEQNGVKVWGAPNVLKVLQSEGVNRFATEYVAAAASKGEAEGTQLILTPVEDISGYDIRVKDLKNEKDTVFSADNISLYMEKYVEVTQKSNASLDWSPGYYPDALVPFAAAKNKNENILVKDKNQGVWITFDVPREQEAGVYQGELEVVLGEKSVKVDLFLEVFDFEIEEEIQAKTNTYTRHEWIIDGELDNSDEMYKKYYDFLLDYNISSTNLPGTRQYWAVEPKDFVEMVKAYVENPKFTGYNLPAPAIFRYEEDAPNQPGQKYGEKQEDQTYGRIIVDTDYDYLYNVIKELAYASDEKVDLLEKAYLYLVFIDEAGMTGSTWEVGNVYTQFKAVKERVLEDLLAEDEAFFQKRVDTLEHSIRYLPSHVTANLDGVIDEFVDELVPPINYYNSSETRERMKAWKAEQDGRALWTYDAWIPQNPHPSNHIDDSVLAVRTKFWMMKSYDVEGFLYWGTAGYRGYKGDRLVPVDVYEDARTFDQGSASPNGDGFFLYPGLDYGIEGPVASIRLEAMRDGIEDYQYIYMLEQELERAKELYGVDFDSKDMMSAIYDQLFTGTIYDPYIGKLIDARMEIARLIELLKNDASAVVRVHPPVIDTKMPYSMIEVYVANGFEVTAEGIDDIQKEASLDGMKYVIKKELTEAQNYIDLAITDGSTTYELTKFVASRIKTLAGFEDKSEISLTAAVGKNAAIDADPFAFENRNTLRINIEDIPDEPTKSAGVRLTKENFFRDISFEEINSLEFDVYVKGDEYGSLGPVANLGEAKKSIGISIEFIGENSKRTMTTIAAAENEWTHIQLGQIAGTNWEEIDRLSAILITVVNSDVAQFDSKSVELYLDDMFVTYASASQKKQEGSK